MHILPQTPSLYSLLEFAAKLGALFCLEYFVRCCAV